jgi:hypothetical protein
MSATPNLYETRRLLDEYLLFHYGMPAEVLPWENGPRDALSFPVRTVMELIDLPNTPCEAAALDLGCAVGRSSFELATFGMQVLGIDYSQSFIDAASPILSSSLSVSHPSCGPVASFCLPRPAPGSKNSPHVETGRKAQRANGSPPSSKLTSTSPRPATCPSSSASMPANTNGASLLACAGGAGDAGTPVRKSAKFAADCFLA